MHLVAWLAWAACSGDPSGDEYSADDSTGLGDSDPDDSSVDDSADDSGGDDSGPIPGDDDGDGWSEATGDCNDSDPSVHPDALEVVGDPTDHNCDGTAVGATASIEEVGLRIFQAAKGTHANQETGGSVAFLPDVTGDGLPDVMIGSPAWQDVFYSPGWNHAYIFAGPFETTRDDGDAWARIDSLEPYDGGGQDVGSLGDLDGDGFPELVYPAAGGLGQGQASVYIFSTPFNGIVTTDMADAVLEGVEEYRGLGSTVEALSGALWALNDWDYGELSIIVRDGLPTGTDPFESARAVLHGDPGDSFGAITHGDLDGDGNEDLVVGDGGRNLDETTPGVGALYLRTGLPSGESDLGDDAATWLGSVRNEHVGDALAVPGDMDGDGRDDVVVGGFFRSTEGFSAGGAYLVLGTETLDGVHVLDGEADLQIVSENDLDSFGDDITGLGDVDGDGHFDAAIHAPRAFTNDEPPPRIYVLLGPPPTGVISAAELDAAWVGTSDEEGAGYPYYVSNPLAGGGDTDLDGIPELLIGSPRVDTDVEDAGAVYLVEGFTF